MLISLVNSLSIWQSEHGNKSMKNNPVKYKIPLHLQHISKIKPNSQSSV